MRSGFTLLELMVVVALILILTTMAFSGFRYMTAVMNKAMNVTKARENLSVVMDQLTKELREVTSVTTGTESNDGTSLPRMANYGVTIPFAGTARGIADVLSSANYGTLGSGALYTFRTSVGNLPNRIVLEFFTIDTSATPAKHRIRYSVTAPSVSGVYTGVAQRYWAIAAGDTYGKYEPCEITYCNNRWTGTTWTTESPQPMTDQVVTGFTVTRQLWSSKAIQITLEAQVRSLSGTGYSTVRLVGLVTVRQ